MNKIILIILGGALAITFLVVIIDLFSMGFNDFLDKYIKKTLWLWLPFHALNRLLREFKEKHLK